MENILLTTDSSCDFPAGYVEDNNIQIIIIPTILGKEQVYKMDNQFLFDYVKKTGELPKTAALGAENYKEFFEKFTKNYDHIIHFSLSSELSAAFKNAFEASKSFKNVTVIDSKNLSSGVALQVMACMDDIKKGLSYKQIVERAEKRVDYVRVSFVLEKLNYMRKGGRCSTITLLGANLLQIKPQIVVDKGKMHVGKKFRGKICPVLKEYTSFVLDDKINMDFTRAFVTYTSAPDNIEKYMNEQLKKAGFKEVLNSTASSTISCHCGPNTVGILYIEQMTDDEIKS